MLAHRARCSAAEPLAAPQASKHAPLVGLLLRWKADPSATDKGRATPLHRHACCTMRRPAPPMLGPHEQRLPRRACSAGKLEAVKALVQARARLDAKDQGGMSPLSIAASCGHSSCALYLASQGASIVVRTGLCAACHDDGAARVLSAGRRRSQMRTARSRSPRSSGRRCGPLRTAA